MKRHSLLIVDDEKEILRSLTLTFTARYEVFTASSGAEALAVLTQRDIALIIADQRMAEMTGAELLEHATKIAPHAIRILLTGYTDTAALIQAVNKGQIYQYISKPWDQQELKLTVQQALERYELVMENQRLLQELQIANERLNAENLLLKKETGRESGFMDTVIGKSAVMRRVFDLVDKVIDNSTTVLLTGETGTGKTLLARYIHRHGPRKNKLFIEQNCGALPEALLESELFGHKRGAFTGAIQDHKGLFEVADGGTLLLDEISEMSPTLQVKLLQILQDGQFRRLGENQYRRVDVRVIAATNREMEDEIAKGRFRSDLYYRLNVFPIHVPLLRDRAEDIPLLAEHCLQKYCRKLNRPTARLSEEALQNLQHYDYPGNVRELENLIERALILNPGNLIEADEWLPYSAADTSGLSRLEQIERTEIERILKLHRGNLSLVAKELGISRTTLWRRIKDYQSRS